MGGGQYIQSNPNRDMLLFRQKPTFSGLVRSRTPPLARSSCLAFLKSSPVGAQGGMAVLLLPPYCATDSLRFPWHSDSFSSGSPRYFNSLMLRSSVRYSDTIPCAYLRYDSVVIKQDQVFYETLCALTEAYCNYTEATERSSINGGDDITESFNLSVYCCILIYINQPHVSPAQVHIIIIPKIHPNKPDECRESYACIQQWET